jgi:hypothetical protein
MERRRFPRGKSFYGGVIAFNTRSSTIDCVVRNFSKAGAKIAMTGTVLLPDVFELGIARKEASFRAHLVWRNSDEAGVAFDTIGSPEVVSLDAVRLLHQRKAEIRQLRRRVSELSNGY